MKPNMKNFDRMKTIINVTIMLFLSVLLCSCNPQACLQRRTDRIIKRSYNQVDTVFVYSIAFHNYKVAWFHKGNLLHLFRIKPHSTKHYKPIEAKNITFNRNTIINLGEFSRTDNKLKLTLSKNGEVPADKQVDMGVFTIGDKNYRVIFATSNLTKDGLAENEYDFGDYFSWGATEPWCTQYSRTDTGYKVQVSLTTWGNTKNATVYDWETVPFRDGNNWYCNQYINNGEKLAMKHDAARQILKGDWQIPTKEIWDKLFESSKYEWTKTKKAEYNGYQVKSKKSETGTIFLPVAGEVNKSSLSGAGTYGSYWSGTANSNDAAYSLYLRLYYTEGNKDISPKYRYYGYSVRPVRLVVESLADPVATTERYGYENDFKWE